MSVSRWDMGDSGDRRERDFKTLAVIIVIALAIYIAMGLISVFGPVHADFGPMVEDHVEQAGPSE
jgi:hypothetical protein